MKIKSSKFLAVFLGLLVLLWALPSGAQQVLGAKQKKKPSAQSIALSTGHGPPNISVTITGDQFGKGKAVHVFFDGKAVGKAKTNAAGGFSLNFTIPAPTPTGVYPVAVGLKKKQSAATQVAFTVDGPASITTTGGVGGAVTVEGSLFGANEAVDILLDGAKAAQATTDEEGAFTQDFTVALTGGQHTVNAVGVSSKRSASAAVSVTPPPAISLSASDGPPGVLVSVTGSNFSPNRAVNLLFDTIFVAVAGADAAGNISQNFTVPLFALVGDHTVTAQDVITGRAGQAVYTVNDVTGLALNPAVGPPTSQVNLSGDLFGSNELVDIFFDLTDVALVQTDLLGVFSFVVTVPRDAGGPTGSRPRAAPAASRPRCPSLWQRTGLCSVTAPGTAGTTPLRTSSVLRTSPAWARPGPASPATLLNLLRRWPM